MPSILNHSPITLIRNSIEVIINKNITSNYYSPCPSDCYSSQSHGICDVEAGICKCYENYHGKDCRLMSVEMADLPFNISNNYSSGSWFMFHYNTTILNASKSNGITLSIDFP